MPIEAGFHSRGYLPHIKVPGATYFVTFRLADSLPKEVVLRLKERREDLLRRAGDQSIDDHKPTATAIASSADEVDSVLDQNHGAAWLRQPDIAALVAGALRHFVAKRYELAAWCVMPNHVHVVVTPYAGYTLDSILHSWKSYTATEANRRLRRRGEPFWQHESYDHWIRDEVDGAHCCEYVRQNPVKAGLCRSAEEWPWSSAASK